MDYFLFKNSRRLIPWMIGWSRVNRMTWSFKVIISRRLITSRINKFSCFSNNCWVNKKQMRVFNSNRNEKLSLLWSQLERKLLLSGIVKFRLILWRLIKKNCSRRFRDLKIRLRNKNVSISSWLNRKISSRHIFSLNF